MMIYHMTFKWFFIIFLFVIVIALLITVSMMAARRNGNPRVKPDIPAAAAELPAEWVVDTENKFIQGAAYSQKAYLGNPDWIETCKAECEANEGCHGFFAQTHLCPQPLSTAQTDPHVTAGKGCHRVCGFFDQNDPREDPETKRVGHPGEGGIFFKRVFAEKSMV
jgi:hypothetical protein